MQHKIINKIKNNNFLVFESPPKVVLGNAKNDATHYQEHITLDTNIRAIAEAMGDI